MPKEEMITLKGRVVETLPNTMFRVTLDNGQSAVAHIPARKRTEYFRILTGDRVVVEFAPPDLVHGRIISRERD